MVWLEGEGGDGGAAHLPSPPSLSHPDPVVRATAVWPSLSLSLPDPARGGGMPEGGRRQWVGWWWVYFFPLIIFLQAGGCSAYEMVRPMSSCKHHVYIFAHLKLHAG